MRELLDRFQETVNLGVLEENAVVYVEILESLKAFRTAARVGGRDLPHATAIGKAMLAFLPEKDVERMAADTGLPKRTENTISALPRLKEELAGVRQRGYAVDFEETEVGACCVGAPIFDHRGEVVAAISISGPAFRFSGGNCEETAAVLVEVTSQISQKLGYMDQG
jgi:DNA-binding IclR family transcriptional regulator